MKEYLVVVIDTVSKYVRIKATSEKEAEQKTKIFFFMKIQTRYQ